MRHPSVPSPTCCCGPDLGPDPQSDPITRSCCKCRPGAGSPSRQAALRAKALQLLPIFLALPAPAKQPIMDAVEKEVVKKFPVISRPLDAAEAMGSTQHKAYLAQLFALFDALWGAADKAYDFIAVLEVCRRNLSCYLEPGVR